MRVAEFVMAFFMGLFSLYLMWKSTELPIGWIPNEGPGGGAFPFWLSFGMFFVLPLDARALGYQDKSPVTIDRALYDAADSQVVSACGRFTDGHDRLDPYNRRLRSGTPFPNFLRSVPGPT